VSVTSRTTGVDKTCESKKVIVSAIYETKDDLVSINQVISQPSQFKAVRFYSRVSEPYPGNLLVNLLWTDSTHLI